MLDLARKYQAEMSKRMGGDWMRFIKGCIQDLGLDPEAVNQRLAAQPIRSAEEHAAFRLLGFR
jgi:hypothetical protein